MFKVVISLAESIIFHIDVNSAYLSWEAAYRLQHGSQLDLRNIPSIVGGDIAKRHGIVLARSTPAKEFNIYTGETIYSALQKCPKLAIVPPNYHLYIKASRALINLLKEYSPLVQQYSIDEAFLDYSNGQGSYLHVAYEIKNRIEKELGFTVNIGISTNKLLAKMASDLKKPNMVHTLFPDEIPNKMWPLPIDKLFMVGSRTKQKLNSRGIFTIGELAKLDQEYIYTWLKKPGLLIWQYANGLENSPVRPEPEPRKSVGNSTTTSFDVDSQSEAHLILLAISEMIGMRVRNLELKGSVISVSLKDKDFFTYSQQKKLSIPTSSTQKIYETARDIFNGMWQGKALRQFSISLSELCGNDFFQLSLMDNYDEREEKLDKTIDHLRNKFGYKSVIRSCFLHSGIEPIIGGVVSEEEYPMMSSLL